MTLLPLLGFQQGVSGVLQGIHNSNKSGPELGKCLTVSPEIDPSTSVRPDQAGILIVINGHCDVVSRERDRHNPSRPERRRKRREESE